MNFIIKIFQKAFTNPLGLFYGSIAIARGSFYIIKYCSLNRKVKIKFPFKAFAPVKIIGPGCVHIDKGCSVLNNVFRGLAIVTLSPDAKVIIGRECILGGLTIRCRKQVKLGNNCISAVSLVQDTLWIHSYQTLTKSESVHDRETMPIDIGYNVWIGGHCCVLGGSRIGNDSAMAFGSVSYNRNQRDFTLGIGNVVTRDLPIDRLIKFRG